MESLLPGTSFTRILSVLAFTVMAGMVSGQSYAALNDGADGLLFYLNGNTEHTVEYAHGDSEPYTWGGMEIVGDGAYGNGLRCPDYSVPTAFLAPGNIYAERGTLAFFWRPEKPLGTAPFKVFQVSYNDHSSMQMHWLRIDYNGDGLDAFVTDANLARVRVSWHPQEMPDERVWTHVAFTWDETRGVRLYIDGTQVASKDTTTVLSSGLGMFGTHGWKLNPLKVRTQYIDVRGGDYDELRIYDSMLESAQVRQLARGDGAGRSSSGIRNMSDSRTRDEWWLRNGWNRDGDIPPYLDAPATHIRKVEIHDAYDLKQWWWKGCDGIRETTWPGVYNRSRITGRDDYFDLPDWNCYSMSGNAVTFSLPDEPWNHLEISGAAFGTCDLITLDRENQKTDETRLFFRPENQERTVHRFSDSRTGGKVLFTNERQETPIGEFSALHIIPGQAPSGTAQLTYHVDVSAEADNTTLAPLVEYITRRYLPDQRSIAVALPRAGSGTSKAVDMQDGLPFVHVLIPADFRTEKDFPRSYTWEGIHGGLDGIEITLPALDVEPTHGEYFPMNVQVRDPLWPNRSMLDFSFSVRPGEERTLWLDTRDRILPDGRSLYLTVAGAGGDFNAASLDGMRIRLVFKDRNEAMTEHQADRFIQAKDNIAHFIEPRPNDKNLNIYDRYHRDLADLLRVNPDHIPGRYYWSFQNPEQGWPRFEQPAPPSDVPLWAFRQVENLRLLEQYLTWWMDNRRIENGEYGGGLSDDSDFSGQFPGVALMGVASERMTDSVLRMIEAVYDNGMFTDGLPTIVTDELHVYEEGVNLLPQTMILDYGDPKVVERLMVTAKAYERITDYNDLGQRQVTSLYYGGDTIYSEEPWAAQSLHYSHLILHPGLALVEFNGHPATKKLLLEIADTVLAHTDKDADGSYRYPERILFPSGDDVGRTDPGVFRHILWAAWRWTGDRKYRDPLIGEKSSLVSQVKANVLDRMDTRDAWSTDIVSRVTPHSGNDFLRHSAWQITGNKQYLEEYSADQIQSKSQQMYINTEGHFWTDRVKASQDELQMARLGGLAYRRGTLYPGHTVSWEFKKPYGGDSVAILIPDATDEAFTVIVFNLENGPVDATMTGWSVAPGTWEVVEGIDTNDDDRADTITRSRTVEFERSGDIELTFPPKQTTVVKLKLKKRGTPYWKRPDLGIGDDDVTIEGGTVSVIVHSLGSVKSEESEVALVDGDGEILARAGISSLAPPTDYVPKTVTVRLAVPAGTSVGECRVVVNPEVDFSEITRGNNSVGLTGQ
jgi:hypothetical protein